MTGPPRGAPASKSPSPGGEPQGASAPGGRPAAGAGGRPGGAWGPREAGASDRESRWSKAPKAAEPRRAAKAPAKATPAADAAPAAAADAAAAAPEAGADADGWETASSKRRGGARANGRGPAKAAV